MQHNARIKQTKAFEDTDELGRRIERPTNIMNTNSAYKNAIILIFLVDCTLHMSGIKPAMLCIFFGRSLTSLFHPFIAFLYADFVFTMFVGLSIHPQSELICISKALVCFIPRVATLRASDALSAF